MSWSTTTKLSSAPARSPRLPLLSPIGKQRVKRPPWAVAVSALRSSGPTESSASASTTTTHTAETGQAVPSEPIVFNKAPNTLIGPNDDVVIPRHSVKTDWEVELGIVIGKRSLYLADETEAAAPIAGYVTVNDVSEREWQIERGGQWVKGKSAPTFNP